MDIFGIREQNIKTVINAIRFENGITKKEIAEKTGLSFATVSNLCNELIEQNVLMTEKKLIPTVGRTPSDIFFNVDRFNTICINLQLKGVMGFAILNFRNEIIFQKKYDIHHLNSAEKIISFAYDVFKKDYLDGNHSDIVFIGVGVAVSSIYDLNSEQLINSAIDLFTDVPLKKIVIETFGIPAYIDNESNLCALSVAKSINQWSDIVYLHISEGVGVGVIVNGKLLRGKNGYGGEVAHMPVGDPNLKCSGCGFYGCVEESLSINGFIREMFGAVGSDKTVKWDQYVQLLKERDEKAVTLARKNGGILGKLSSVLINIFDPEAFYIGGDITAIFPFIKDAFEEEIKNRSPLIADKDLKIICDAESEKTINIGINEEICNSWLPL